MLFNLANQYHANKLYAEALNTYQVIVKNKMFSNAGKLHFTHMLRLTRSFLFKIFQHGWSLLIFVSDYNKFEPDK